MTHRVKIGQERHRLRDHHQRRPATMTTSAGTTMTTTAGTTMTTEMTEPTEQVPRVRRPGFFQGLRVRMLVPFVALLTLATLGSVVVVRALLIHRLDERIDSDLTQEVRELRRLSTGNDPETGEPFAGDVKRIFEVFLRRNIPIRYEAQLTFVDGRTYLRSRLVFPYRVDRDETLVDRWGRLEESDRGRVETPRGDVDYLAVPVRGGATHGVFVVAVFRDLAQEAIEPAIAGAAAVGGLVLLIGSLLAWRVADRILHPVSKVTATARAISEGDLRRRIDIQDHDEIGELAATFNEMLDRLEEAFNTQRRFIDDASHELRTPITIIRGQLGVLEDDPDDRRKTMEIVMDELDRMTRFVEDLLLLARARRPDFLRFDTVDVATLTDELVAKATTLAPRRWEVDAVGRGRIVIDLQRITQAVMQLAQNATRHTRDGQGIGLGSAIGDGEARFWVRDEGPGIPPGEQEQIFERFRRGPNSGRSDGAGLGLSIVKAIAEAHRGRVEVNSLVGHGSTFTVVVPVDQPEDDGERVP